MVESCQFSTSSCSSCSLAALAHVDRNHAGCESVNVKIEPSSVNEKFSNFRRRKTRARICCSPTSRPTWCQVKVSRANILGGSNLRNIHYYGGQRLSVSFCLACEEVLRQCANHQPCAFSENSCIASPESLAGLG